MLLLPISREDLLDFLPKGLVVAEIGVATGEFSGEIMKRTSPARLHLIDPWVQQNRPDYQSDTNNVPDNEQEIRYQGVLSRFATDISNGKIVVHRAFSGDICNTFDDNYFDWIYVDGMHTYDGAMSDLSNYASKVKPNGLILGHDYTNHSIAKKMGIDGVVRAADDFVIKQGWQFMALTMDKWPSYVLCRSSTSKETQRLWLKLIYNIPRIIEIRDYPQGQYVHKLLSFDDTKQRLLMSF